MTDSEDTQLLVPPSRLRTIPFLKNYASIRPYLQKMAQEQYGFQQILQILRKFKNQSTKDCYEGKHQHSNVSFQVLEQLFSHQLPEIMAQVAKFVQRKQNYELTLLKKRQNISLSITKQAVLYLICMMSLCLIPKQEYHEQKNKNFAYQIDFSFIFSHNKYKTKAVIQYIKRQIKKSAHYEERLTITRVSTTYSLQNLIEERGNNNMCKLKMAGDNESIQNYFGCLKIDFANAFIGGGALGSGCVQEQIMFSNHPQLFITPLLCQRMQHNEAVILIGFKKYSCNSGYSYKTKYLGPQFHKYQYDEQKRAKEYIAAIDALSFPKNSKQQFRKANIKRQLLKSYTGFNVPEVDGVVTGNWGCGAFGGDLRTKLLIQWIACSLAGKQLIYCPFGERQKVYNKKIIQKISKHSINIVYKMVLQACRICYKKTHKKIADQINIYQQLNFELGKKIRPQNQQIAYFEATQ